MISVAGQVLQGLSRIEMAPPPPGSPLSGGTKRRKDSGLEMEVRKKREGMLHTHSPSTSTLIFLSLLA